MKFETRLPFTMGGSVKIVMPKKIMNECGIFPGSRVEIDAKKSDAGALVLTIKRLAPLPEKPREPAPEPWFVKSGKNAALEEIREREELSGESRHLAKGTSHSFDFIMKEAIKNDLELTDREALLKAINNGEAPLEELPKEIVGSIGFKIRGIPEVKR